MRLILPLLLLLVACAAPPAPGTGTPAFQGRLLALSDTDMAATAYADGKLEPLAGVSDTLSLVDAGGTRFGAAPAPNSVLSWPQVLAVSPDRGLAYVVETRAAPPAGAERLASVRDLPPGRRLTVIRVDGEALRVVAEADAGLNPQSVSLSADGRWLAIAGEAGGGELVVFELKDGLPGQRFAFPLRVVYEEGDPERLPRTLAWSPAGDWLAVNVALRRVAFFELLRGPDGAPIGLRQHGAALPVGKRLSRGLWTPDGRYYLTSDINAGPGALERVIGAPGVVSAIAFDPGPGAAHRVAARARVGGSPEGIALSPDGRRVATVNLERTFLPELWLLDALPGRDRYSLDLLDFDPASGALRPRSRVVAEGILPEDAVFDATSQHLAVAVFHRRKGPDRRRGFIDFFSIEDGALVARGRPAPLPRGAHDLEALP